MFSKCIVVIALIAVVAAGEEQVAKIQSCGSENINCEVSEVRIDPCRPNKKCVFRKGINATLSFDFTPGFAAEELLTTVFWVSTLGEVPFEDLNRGNVCTLGLSTCPTEAGKSQQLRYILPIKKLFPKGNYLLKWKTFNAANEQDVCCFLTNIQIT